MLFISWSGSPSKEIGFTLKQWLEGVFDELEIFFSEETQPGRRWTHELAQVLESSQVGLFIHTRSNLNSLWMAFEAGALSKRTTTGHVMPLIFGANTVELSGPLAQFQARRFTKEGMLHILQVINETCLDEAKTKDYLQRNIEMTWRYLNAEIEGHLLEHNDTEAQRPEISQTLETIFSLLQSSHFTNPEFSSDIAQLVREVKSSHEDTKALLAQVKTTLRGSYLFIDGTEPAFAALTAATMRAKR